MKLPERPLAVYAAVATTSAVTAVTGGKTSTAEALLVAPAGELGILPEIHRRGMRDGKPDR